MSIALVERGLFENEQDVVLNPELEIADGEQEALSLVSLDLNFSNRPVRTRMPGGVAGEQLTLPPMPIIFDTPALQSIQWRHNVAPGGGITVNWVAELTVSSNYVAAEAKRLARKAKRKSDRAIDSNGKWEVVNGVQFIPDSTNPRG